MLIAEDLLLLLTDDDSGTAAASIRVDLGLAGALLAELVLLNRVDLAADGERVRKGRLVVRDPSPTEDDLLDTALERLANHEGRRPEKGVRALTKQTRRHLYLRLAERGLVRQHESKLFGMTLRTTWPAEQRSHEQLLRAHLATALDIGSEIAARDSALLMVLAAVGRLDIVAAGRQTALSRRDIRRMNDELARSWWVSDAVRRAVASHNAAVAGGISAATSAAVISP
jgi:hypothetical protein